MAIRKIRVQEVLNYLSVENSTCGYFGYSTVGDFLFGTMKTHGDVPFEKTLEALRTKGQQYPIHVGLGADLAGEYGLDSLGAEDKMVLGNGHNRVEAAFTLGWEYIDATDKKEESGLTAGIRIAQAIERAEDLDLIA